MGCSNTRMDFELSRTESCLQNKCPINSNAWVASKTFPFSHWSGASWSAQQPSPIGWNLDAKAVRTWVPQAHSRSTKKQWIRVNPPISLSPNEVAETFKVSCIVRGLWLVEKGQKLSLRRLWIAALPSTLMRLQAECLSDGFSAEVKRKWGRWDHRHIIHGIWRSAKARESHSTRDQAVAHYILKCPGLLPPSHTPTIFPQCLARPRFTRDRKSVV